MFPPAEAWILKDLDEEFLAKGGKKLISKKQEKALLSVVIFFLKRCMLVAIPQPFKSIIIVALKSIGITFKEDQAVKEMLTLLFQTIKGMGVEGEFWAAVKAFINREDNSFNANAYDALREIWLKIEQELKEIENHERSI